MPYQTLMLQTYKSTKYLYKTRAKTTGVVEYQCLSQLGGSGSVKDPSKATKLTFIDVGGQRGERKKWINLFREVDNLYLIYLVAVRCGHSTILFYLYKKIGNQNCTKICM